MLGKYSLEEREMRKKRTHQMQLPLLPPSCPTCPVWTSPSSFPFHIIAISKPLFCLTVTQVRSVLVL